MGSKGPQYLIISCDSKLVHDVILKNTHPSRVNSDTGDPKKAIEQVTEVLQNSLRAGEWTREPK